MEAQTQIAKTVECKRLFERDDVKKKFHELMGKRSSAFITSVLQIVASNALLAKADPSSIYHAAATAATLDLPLNNSLGFAYIIPYNTKVQDSNGKWHTKQLAQFQLGYRGFIQLAQRSGQFKNMSATPIYDGQLKSQNPLTGYVFDFSIKASETVIGYAGYFSLVNGFEKTLYMTVEEIKRHGERYSKNYKSENSLWKTDFNSMALKTVLKQLLSKYAPLSIDVQKAFDVDDATDVTYEDSHPETTVDQQHEEVTLRIQSAESIEELEAIAVEVEADQVELFNQKKEELKATK